jgi:hypothetical protein
MLDMLVRWIDAGLRDQRGGVGGTVLAVIVVIGIVIAAVIALLVPD